MDIFLQGEWFEFKFPKGKILKLKLRPAPYEEQMKWPERDFYDVVLDYIIDWEGLAKAGEKIEPTPENIKTYLRYFLTSNIERIGEEKPEIQETGPGEEEERPRPKTLGIHLIEILQNIENFLGN